MLGHYLPASPRGDILAIHEAMTLAIHGEPSADTKVFIGPQGEIKFVAPECYLPDPAKAFEQFVRGASDLREALRAAKIRALVPSANGSKFYHVPRHYWMRHDPTATAGVLEDSAAPAELVGQPLVMDAANLDEWRAALSDAARAPLAATPSLTKPSSSTAFSGRGRPTHRQQEAFRFFGLATQHMKGGSRELNATELFSIYRAQFAKGKFHGTPFERTTFEDMRSRFIDGWRVDGRRWRLSD